MAKLLEKSKVAVKRLKPADVVEGRVAAKTKDELVLDIGAKAEGLVSGREFEESAQGISSLNVGDKILATVVQSEDSRGFVLLSLKKAEVEADWREAKKAMDEERINEVEILGPNRGGVVAKFSSLRGFIPFSHLSVKNKMAANLGQLTGKVVKAKVIEMDQDLDRLVMSEREAQTEGERKQDVAALSKVKAGEQYEGEVSSVTPFAAFVQFTHKGEKNPIEGMMHVSEISWEKVAEATQALKAGQKIKVEILEVDTQDGRVMVSARKTQPNPWEKLAQNYVVGSKVKGKVTKIADFGAFVELEPGIEGLIHVTETTGPLAEGNEVEARVLEVDPKKQKIALSLKAVGAAWR